MTDVDCAPPASTSTTTSTTLSCDEASCPAGEHCARGECTAEGTYEIDFSITNDASIGAIQISL